MNKLSTIISITQILEKNQHTYDDVQDILHILEEHYKTVRECIEYENFEDFKNGNKTTDASKMKVRKLNNISNDINEIINHK